jgi:GMP synthase-like glutamine amidotransferase
LKIVVVNNYKEDEKAQQAIRNLARCTGQKPEMLDYKTRNLVEAVRNKSPDLVIMTGSNFMLSKSDTKTVFREEMDMIKKLDLPFLGICFGY